MTKSRNTLITHPIRLRIMGTLSERRMTSEQISQLMDDVPPATLYRHINTLIEGELIAVVGERRQQGRTTRELALKDNAGLLNRAEIDVQSVEGNTQAVNAFLTGLIAVYASAVRDSSISPGDWGLTAYRANLSPKEEAELVRQVHVLLLTACDNPPGRGRRRRVLSFGALPEREERLAAGR